MMDGLGSVSEAALYIGNYNVYAFEIDPKTWQAAQKNLSFFISKLKKKDLEISKQLQSYGGLHYKLNKIRAGEDVILDTNDVSCKSNSHFSSSLM